MGSLKKSPLFTFCAGKEIISKGKILYSSPRTWLWHSFDMKVNIFHQGDRNWRTQLQGEKLRKRQEAPLWACPQNSHGWFLMRDYEGKDTTLVSVLHILRGESVLAHGRATSTVLHLPVFQSVTQNTLPLDLGFRLSCGKVSCSPSKAKDPKLWDFG